MQFRVGVLVCSIIAAGAALSGCPTGGNSGVQGSFMQRCTADAKSEQERSECAWKNAERMAGGP